jgi:hypothetical protein
VGLESADDILWVMTNLAKHINISNTGTKGIDWIDEG